MGPRMVLIFIAICCTGCTHVQLKRSSVNQLSTVSDIYHRQVLDNLAMLYVDPAAMPHFAVVADGTTQVNDTASGNVGIEWSPTLRMFGFDSERSVAEEWSLAPVTDPDRLRQMRQVYLYVLAGIKPTGPDNFEKNVMPGHWFVVGQELRDDDCCGHTGEYCGTHIRVPNEHSDNLTQLTLAMLDIATFEPDVVEITVQKDKNGNVTGSTEKSIQATGLQNRGGINRRDFYVPSGGQGLRFVR